MEETKTVANEETKTVMAGRINNSSLVNWQSKRLESVAMACPLISSDIMSLLGKSARPHTGKHHRTKYIDQNF